MQGNLVNIEASIADGMSRFTIVGLPDTSVNEARDRVLTAFKTGGVYLSECHITVNLGPASLQKRGSHYDLAIAVAVMGAYGVLDKTRIGDTLLLGELGLDGRIHPVRGVLPAVNAAFAKSVQNMVVPIANLEEAKLISGANVLGFGHISEVINHFGGESTLIQYTPVKAQKVATSPLRSELDMKDVLGQSEAKYALEVAAAGFHNIFMQGPPGTGKSMLAARLVSILPRLTLEEAIEVTSIYSLSGQSPDQGLMFTPPFEAPHHTATAPAIIGGGSGGIHPGAISRAHNGVLFLDEAPEFSPRVLQTLRQPLENGVVNIERSSMKAEFLAHFQLVLAANPCPCGMYSASHNKCKCTSIMRRRYLGRLSGPLLDRIDIFTNVENVRSREMSTQLGEDSATIRARVEKARLKARKRWEKTPWKVNSEVPGSYLRKMCSNKEIMGAIHDSVDRGVLSLRGADRVLRLSWTVADLNGDDELRFEHIEKALSLKGGGMIDG
jgi:magnesium chelatase family protein